MLLPYVVCVFVCRKFVNGVQQQTFDSKKTQKSVNGKYEIIYSIKEETVDGPK